MRSITNLMGVGMLTADGSELGPADYEMIIYEDDRGRRSGKGRVNGAIPTLHRAFTAKDLEITRHDTKKPVRIIVTEFQGNSAWAPFLLAGGDLGD